MRAVVVVVVVFVFVVVVVVVEGGDVVVVEVVTVGDGEEVVEVAEGEEVVVAAGEVVVFAGVVVAGALWCLVAAQAPTPIIMIIMTIIAAHAEAERPLSCFNKSYTSSFC